MEIKLVHFINFELIYFLFFLKYVYLIFLTKFCVLNLFDVLNAFFQLMLKIKYVKQYKQLKCYLETCLKRKINLIKFD